MTDAARIVYHLETAYLTSNSTFANARVWAIDAARSLFGSNSNQVVQTTNAWYAVGVGEEYQHTISGPTTVCYSGTTFSIDNLPAVDSIIWSTGSNLTVYSGPGRAAHYFAAPPQIRTSGFPAYGSSQLGFAER